MSGTDQDPFVKAREERDEAREALGALLRVSGSCHMVKDGPNAGWVEWPNGQGGDFNEDTINDPDCPVCAAEKRAAEVLHVEWTPPKWSA